MKKITGFMLLLLLMAACKKKDNDTAHPYGPSYEPITIGLQGKPLDTIYKYTSNAWRLLKSEGGIAGTTQYYPDASLDFYSSQVVWHNDTSNVNYLIDTFRSADIFGDSTYLMHPAANPTDAGLVIQQIINDTMYLSDNYADGNTYILLKLRPVY